MTKPHWIGTTVEDPGEPTFPPLDEPGRPRHGVCPNCGHAAGTPRDQPWLFLKLGLKPRAARCQEQSEDWEASGGLGSARCGCSHPFHGS